MYCLVNTDALQLFPQDQSLGTSRNSQFIRCPSVPCPRALPSPSLGILSQGSRFLDSIRGFFDYHRFLHPDALLVLREQCDPRNHSFPRHLLLLSRKAPKIGLIASLNKYLILIIKIICSNLYCTSSRFLFEYSSNE